MSIIQNNEDITIFAVDDNEDGLFALSEALKLFGYKVETENQSSKAFERAYEIQPDLILLDVMMPEINGLDLVKKFKEDSFFKYIPVVLLSSMQDLDDVLKGFAFGADDYIGKPFKKDELFARINAIIRTRKIYQELSHQLQLKEELQQQAIDRYSFSNIIGKSKKIKEVFSLINRVADTNASVLINGESGTGKELVAQALHYNSSRKDKPFIVQNCSALSEQLLESELFGHSKGAFTGAIKDRKGLFEVADGGTFFLDELGEMSQALQVKLLRVLQDGTFTPVGSSTMKKVDVRIVAATNRDLIEMIESGDFREDLYYRLNVVTIKLPPLRDRKEDIPLLCEFFLKKLNNNKVLKFSNDAIAKLISYDWPGNIRQLQNEVERATIMNTNKEFVGIDALSDKIKGVKGRSAVNFDSSVGDLKDILSKVESEVISSALLSFNNNKSKIARELGISRSSLISKIKAYNLE